MAEAPKRLSVEERARLYVAKLDGAVKGQNGHATGFHVACVLVQGFALSESTAFAILEEYNRRCDPPFGEKQLRRKITCAAAAPGLMTKEGLKPKGCLRDARGRDDEMGKPIATDEQGRRIDPAKLQSESDAYWARQQPAPKPEFAPKKLTELAARWRDAVDLVWLANRSAFDPAQVTAAGFLAAMYQPGEKILCFNEVNRRGMPWTQGESLWPNEVPPAAGSDGVWFLAQPVDGKYYPNPRGETKDGKHPLSRRSQESVTAFRYMLLESDKAALRDWLGLLVQVPLRIDAIYTSGGRSIHALVRVDCATKGAWDEEKRAMDPTLRLLGLCGADAGALSAVRLTRLPGCMRQGKRDAAYNHVRFARPALQKLLYLRPAAPLRPLMDVPAVRDVEAFWCEQAGRGVGDADEGSGLAWLRAGLAYYANVSARVRAAAEDFERRFAEAGA